MDLHSVTRQQLPEPVIKHHGATTGVTGSCHELQITPDQGILIDCGLFQGAETSGAGANAGQLEIDFDITHIQALVVTHVHIDHVGRIPYLLAAGFDGPIYCTEASAILLPLVLEDAIKIGFTRNRRLVERVLKKLRSQIIPVPYKLWRSVEGCQAEDSKAPSLSIKFQPAGHILGSAYVECRLRQPGWQDYKVIFSGDLGAPYAPLLPAPKAPYSADTLVIESTYGDKDHPPRRQRKQQMKKLLERTVKEKGVLLIPAFSIGRTQELLYELEALIHQNGDRQIGATNWQDIEVILDSPLAAEFTEAYRKLKKYWDKEARRRLSDGRHPLSFEQLYTVGSHKEHMETVDYLQRKQRPCVVIAASGMCEGGRIVNYLKALLGQRRNCVAFVGYQAQGTVGRQIQKYGARGGYVIIDDEKHNLAARIAVMSGYSAHAGQKDLVNFICRMRRTPSKVRIVHGDEDAKAELKQRLEALLAESAEVVIP